VTLFPEHIQTALSAVNLKEPRSRVFVSAPPDRQGANAHPSLIVDDVPLPSLVLLRSRSYLAQLYTRRGLSAREVARTMGVSHGSILAALDRYGIQRNDSSPKRKGQVPFGFDYANSKLVRNKQEQEVIRIMRQYRVSGRSLREIADNLNQKLVPTNSAGIWQANTVRKILARV